MPLEYSLFSSDAMSSMFSPAVLVEFLHRLKRGKNEAIDKVYVVGSRMRNSLN